MSLKRTKYHYLSKELVAFLTIIVATISFTIIKNEILSTIWYLLLIYFYSKSKNESFWLAFFLTNTDGFFGFLGLYSTVINAIPGLPGIELAQFYILITLFKISAKKNKLNNQFKNWLGILFGYALLLVVFGQINGLHGEINVYFKIAKLLTPLLLFYSVPRLLNSVKDYADLFKLISMVFLVGFIAQLFTVLTGHSPANNYLLEPGEELEIGRNLRTFYNPIITLLSLLLSMFFLSIKNQNYFSKLYLNTIMLLCFFMAFLSATRGWIIGIGTIIILFNIFITKFSIKNIILFSTILTFLVIIGINNTKIKQQVEFSIERGLTLDALLKGDKSASGTLARLDERGPKVIAAWEDNPVFGWGFSDLYFEKQDGHVGNLNLLLHSGIVGLFLMFSFILYLNLKLIRFNLSETKHNLLQKSALVIPIFLIGWLFIHSTSSQQFAYYGMPLNIFPQAILFSMVLLILNYRQKSITNE